LLLSLNKKCIFFLFKDCRKQLTCANH
jgi:hypothetical protein